MEEFIVFETFLFLSYKDLLNASIVNKSFHKVYNDYKEYLWEEIFNNSPEALYIKGENFSTFRTKNYALSYGNKFNKINMFYNFLKHLK